MTVEERTCTASLCLAQNTFGQRRLGRRACDWEAERMGDNYGASYHIKSIWIRFLFFTENSALDSYKNAPSRTSPHPTHPLLPPPHVSSLAYSTVLPMRSSLVSHPSRVMNPRVRPIPECRWPSSQNALSAILSKMCWPLLLLLTFFALDTVKDERRASKLTIFSIA
jgi:hypothetical protein